MAARPDYTIGTISLVSGSKNFTTSGSSLQSAVIERGDTIMTRSGLVLVIETITGQNAGTLAENCPAGAAGNGQPLRIRFQPDGSRYKGAVRDLIGRWGQNGNVDALAGLTTAKDMLAFFTGAGTADVTALTAWARTMLAATNGAGGYAALGNVPIAFLPHLQGATGDGFIRLTTSGTGDGAGEGVSTIGITANGNFYLMRDGQNVVYWNTEGIQTLGNVPVQRLSGVVGTVNAAETGAIFQQGSNANGDFIRFMGGTQICWGMVTVTEIIANTISPTAFTFPASFSSAPRVAQNANTSVPGTVVLATSVGGITNNGATAYVLRANATNTNITWIATGRWKN